MTSSDNPCADLHAREQTTKYRQRAAKISGTCRTNFRFMVQEWQEIDALADASGMHWTDWARQIVQASPHLPMSEAIRKTLRENRQAEQLRAGKTGQEIVEQAEDLAQRLLKFAGRMNELGAELERLRGLIEEAPKFFHPGYDFEGEKLAWLKRAGLTDKKL